MKNGIKSNLSIDYAILIAVVVAALIGMSLYFTRAISGRWRQAADVFGYGRLATETNYEEPPPIQSYVVSMSYSRNGNFVSQNEVEMPLTTNCGRRRATRCKSLINLSNFHSVGECGQYWIPVWGGPGGIIHSDTYVARWTVISAPEGAEGYPQSGFFSLTLRSGWCR